MSAGTTLEVVVGELLVVVGGFELNVAALLVDVETLLGVLPLLEDADIVATVEDDVPDAPGTPFTQYA